MPSEAETVLWDFIKEQIMIDPDVEKWIKSLVVEKIEIDKPDISKCPQQEIVNLYHEILPELRRVRAWNATRQKNLRQRWKEDKSRQNIEWWAKFFKYIRKCDFLMGKVTNTNRPFQADLGWLINSTNMTKVIEGFYEKQ